MVKAGVNSKKFFRPVLQPQIALEDPEDWGKRMKLFGENVSGFFTQLYAEMYGGKVIGELWGKKGREGLNGNKHNYSPDIVRISRGRRTDIEVKVSSARNTSFQSGLVQERNNLYQLLTWIDGGVEPLPQIEYLFVRYGRKETLGLIELSNEELVKTLAESRIQMLALPASAVWYWAAHSRVKTHNQKSSQFSKDSQEYHILKGKVMSYLLNQRGPTSDIIREAARPDAPKKRVLSELLLDDLEVEESETPRVEGFFDQPFVIEPFPITRYHLPEETYLQLAQNLLDNHSRIARAVGIEDLFGITQNLPDIPFQAPEGLPAYAP